MKNFCTASALGFVVFSAAQAQTASQHWFCESPCAAYASYANMPVVLDRAMGAGESLAEAFSDCIADCRTLMVESEVGSWDMYLAKKLDATYSWFSLSAFGAFDYQGEYRHLDVEFAFAKEICSRVPTPVDIKKARRKRIRYRGNEVLLGG